MTKAKNTKKALWISVVSLLLCVAMFAGTTYAWFSDSVTNRSHLIAGNLDGELEYYDLAQNKWLAVDSATKLLDDGARWEPGYTEVVYLRVRNYGSLALKYQLGVSVNDEISGVNQNGESFKLSDHIMFGGVEGVNGETGKYANREAAVAAVTGAKKLNAGYTKASSMTAGQELYLALVVYMPEEVGNVANYRGDTVPEVELGITVKADQIRD